MSERIRRGREPGVGEKSNPFVNAVGPEGKGASDSEIVAVETEAERWLEDDDPRKVAFAKEILKKTGKVREAQARAGHLEAQRTGDPSQRMEVVIDDGMFKDVYDGETPEPEPPSKKKRGRWGWFPWGK